MNLQKLIYLSVIILAVFFTSCKNSTKSKAVISNVDNPFFEASKLPFKAPAFDKIKDADYKPAMEEGMKQQQAEIAKIADNPAPPTFENTLVALEKSGVLLNRVNGVFSLVTSANTNPEPAKSAGR